MQRDDFGVHDNFFDVGGHSMQAVSLIKRIGEELQVECPLSLLFQYPTVSGLCSALSLKTDVPTHTAVQLLAAGTDKPLFCLSGTDLYGELAARLPEGSCVYGLVSQAEANLITQGARLPDIIELADTYVATIQHLQPHGTVQVGGFFDRRRDRL